MKLHDAHASQRSAGKREREREIERKSALAVPSSLIRFFSRESSRESASFSAERTAGGANLILTSCRAKGGA